jgi:hypothetical protein
MERIEGDIIKEHSLPYDYYDGDDEVAKKLKLTKKQYEFVQAYLKS